MNMSDVVNGNTEKLFSLKEDLQKNRLKICYSCPLYSKKHGGTCNSGLYLNVNTGDVSTKPKSGYKNGCGCIIIYKVKDSNAKCPLDKW